MYCIICKQEVSAGVSALQKDGAFLILGSIEPDAFERYNEAHKTLTLIGWEECIICCKCQKVI